MGYISNIIVDYFTAIAKLIGNLAKLCIYIIDLVFVTGPAELKGSVAWSPNISYLKTTMLGASYDNIMLFFRYVGFFAATILFAVNFFLMWRSDGNVKDTAVSAIRKFFTAIIVVTLSIQIMDFIDSTIMTVEQKFWNIEKASDGHSGFWDTDKENAGVTLLGDIVGGLKNDTEEQELTTDNALPQVLMLVSGVAELPQSAEIFAISGAALVVVSIAYALFTAIMALLIAYYYFKLAIELIRRYLSWAVLHMTMPAVSGTLATGYTSEIFWTYIKSYASEGICLFMTYFFMKGASMLIGSLGTGLVSTFVIISWINIGIDLDRFMKDHGFSISAAGGNLAEGMLASVARMSMAGSMIGGGVGSALVGAGTALGNVPLTQLGTLMKTGDASVAGAVNAMSNGLMGQVMKNTSLGNTGKGVAPELTASELGAMTSLFHSGDAKSKGAFNDKFNQLSAADRNAVLGSIKDNLTNNGANGAFTGENSLAAKFGKDAAESMRFTGIDSRGNIVGEMDGKLGKTKFTVSPNAVGPNSTMFESADGKDNYITMGATGDRSDTSLDGIALDNIVDGDSISTETLNSSEISWNSKINTDDFNKFLNAIDDDVLNPVVDEYGTTKENYRTASNWTYKVDDEGQECMIYNNDPDISYRTDGRTTTYSYGEYKNKSFSNFLKEIHSSSK